MILAITTHVSNRADARRACQPRVFPPGCDQPFHENKTVAEEVAFRRGFHHSTWVAACAVRAGATLADFLNWHTGVDAWRHGNVREIVGPPFPSRVDFP